MKSDHIPKATIARLALYVQALEILGRSGEEIVSSEKLAVACAGNPSQIRKDLAYFGEFGVRGVGYYVKALIESIKKSLGIDRVWNCALIGVGDLGRALLKHPTFPLRGFVIRAAFDCDPDKIGRTIQGMEVLCPTQLKEAVPEMNLEIGLITTPPDRAQRAANHLVEAGIKGILNFAPACIAAPAHVQVEHVSFFHHLYALAFHIGLGRS